MSEEKDYFDEYVSELEAFDPEAYLNSQKDEAPIAKNMEPLTLKDIGCFYVGGEPADDDGTGNVCGPEKIYKYSMFVEYMIPNVENPKPPVIMVHGGAYTGACYSTTPDGREGWNTMFVRAGHPVYIIDQVERGRSPWNDAGIQVNRIAAGASEEKLCVGVSGKNVLMSLTRGCSQYPVNSFDDAARALVPDWYVPVALMNNVVGGADPHNTAALVELIERIGPAILLVHSQGGSVGWSVAAAAHDKLLGMVSVEPACGSVGFDEESIPSEFPIELVYGDRTLGYWGVGIDAFKELSTKRNVTVDILPEMGIKGNSHMMMHDKNNGEVAQVIIDWIDKNIKA